MIILGIDPGTATTGYGLLRKEGSRMSYIACGIISTPAGLDPWVRLHMIGEDLVTLLDRYGPVVAGVEQVFFSTNVKTAISVAQARGVILERLHGAGVAIREYSPLTVKNTVTGYGGADKRQMQECIRLQLGLDRIPTPDDAADALGIALCAGLHY